MTTLTDVRASAARNIALFIFKRELARDHLPTIEIPKQELDDKVLGDPDLEAAVKSQYDEILLTYQTHLPDWASTRPTDVMQRSRSNPQLAPILNEMRANGTKAAVDQALAAYRQARDDVAAAAQNAAAAPPDDPSAAPDPPASSDEPPLDIAYAPIEIPAVDESALSTADRILQSASSGRLTSLNQVVKKLAEAQSVIQRYRANAPHIARARVEADADFPAGEVKLLTAANIFASKIPPDQASRFTFKLPVYSWERPHPLVPQRPTSYQFDPMVLRPLLWAISKGKNSVLVGPTGCGKTTAVETVAAYLGRPFFRVAVDGEMRKRELIGGFKQTAGAAGSETRWFDGLIAQALKMPSILDIDEIDRADPDLQYVAHQVYEGKGITILEDEGRHIEPHPHHAIVATANTKGRDDGESPYQLRNEMSEATRDRFAFWIECDYMQVDQETAQLTADVPGFTASRAKRLIQVANLMRAAFKKGTLNTTCSYRQLVTAADYAFDLQTRSTDDLQKAAECEAIQTLLVSRAAFATDASAILEFGHQVYGDHWPTPTAD